MEAKIKNECNEKDKRPNWYQSSLSLDESAQK